MRVLSKRLVKILAPILLLGLVVLVGTPLLIKHLAVRWLEQNGGDRVRFEDVDLNPFTGKLVLKGLEVQVADDTTLAFKSASADLAFGPLWHKQLAVEAITLEDLDILIRQLPDQTRIGGIRLPAAGEAPPTAPEAATAHPWTAGIDSLVLNHIRVRYLDAALDLTLVLDSLQLTHLAQWSAEAATPVTASGSINQAAFSLSGDIAPFAATPRYDLKLKLDGLSLAAFATLAGEQFAALSGKLSYEGALDYRQQADGFEFDQDGSVRLQGLDAALKQPALAIKGDDMQTRSQLKLAKDGDTVRLRLNYDADLKALDVSADSSKLLLLHSAGLKLKGLEMTANDRLSLHTLEADGLVLARRAQDADPALAVDHLQVDTLALADDLLSIDRIRLDGAHNRLQRDSAGNWDITAVVDDIARLGKSTADTGEASTAAAATTDAEQPAATGDGAEPAKTLAYAIGSIEIGGDSNVSLADQSVKPALQTRIDIKAFHLGALDSRQPEQKSAIELDAVSEKHASIKLKGDVQPLLNPPGMTIESTISALALTPLSPYAEQAMGLKLDSGTLDADIHMNSEQHAMDGLVKLKLYQLALESVESKNSLQSHLPVPVNVALDTLRDSDNTIALKIPIKGDPANPAFNINDVLTKALAGGVQKGALTYLTMALQPYGAMITAAKYAGEAITKVRLNPVGFAAGSSDLDATGKDYLSKVAKVLKDRPQLAIKVCGVAVTRDRSALQTQSVAAAAPATNSKQANQTSGKPAPPPPAVSDAQLNELAQARAEAVRSHLVDSFKTPASRLVDCQPRIEAGDGADAAPRTDLLL